MDENSARSLDAQPAFLRLDHPLLAMLLIAAIAIVFLFALRPGQEWDGDFALYIMNAKNIVLGLPYGKTAYVLNPENAINPAAYPPGLPLLFAPVYALWGVDLVKFKVLCIAALMLFLWVFYKTARTVVAPSSALATTALVGLHPYILDSENSPVSEFPFMLFCYAALWLLQGLPDAERKMRRWPLRTLVLTAMSIAFAYLTRSIGILLFPVAFLVSVFHARRLVTATNVSLAGAVVLIVLAQCVFPADIGTYVHYFDHFTLHSLVISVKRYLGVRTTLFGQAAVSLPLLGIGLGLVLLALALVGYVDRLRKAFSVFEVFLAAYIAFLIIYPITLDVSRYAMPIWPLLFLYAARGIELCVQRAHRAARWAAPAGAMAVMVVLYGVQYRTMSFDEIPYSVTAAPSQELFSQIRERLPAESRFLTRKPTIVGLYTGHESTISPAQFTDDELWQYLKSRQIDYVIQDLNHSGVHASVVDVLDPFIQRQRAQLRPVFHNAWFNIYHVEPPSSG